MLKPVPDRHVVSGFDAHGAPTPVAYRVTYRRPDTPRDKVLLRFPFVLLRWEIRELREQGYEVEVEPLFEMPSELLERWMVMHLNQMMPPGDRSAFGELARRAIRRAEQIRRGEIVERNGETLFAAVRPGSDEVLDLVFTRGKHLIYSRVGAEWVLSHGIDDFEYKLFSMNSVEDAALTVFDERRAAGRSVLLSHLRECGTKDGSGNNGKGS
jgi:hypothetical protein